MNKYEIKLLLQKNKNTLKNYGIKKIGLFGSAVRNELTKESDIDIVVEFEKGKATMKNFILLSEFLENLLSRKVDILTPEGINSIRIKYIKDKIKREIEYVWTHW